MSNSRLREAEAQHYQDEYHNEHDRMLRDRLIYDSVVNAKPQELQHELEIVDRLRNRSYDVQRTIEELVKMRGQPREEAVRCGSCRRRSS